MRGLLSIQIDRFVDDHQPGFVECSLIDAHGTRHLFLEKVPVVTAEHLWSDSTYPSPGVIACRIERELKDQTGQTLLQVNTELPWHVESTTGETRFVVQIGQVRSDHAA
jgi:hypothetical protein